MFYEGDLVEVTLDESVQAILEDALEEDFEEIEFYFVEYADEHYAVLSAETDEKFAIIQCPLASINGYYNDEAEVENLLYHVVHTHLLDRALETRNKKLFQAVMAYEKPAETQTEPPRDIFMNIVIDMSGDFIEETMEGEAE